MSKILIVDDDRELVSGVASLLDAHGHHAVSAFDGTDGYRKAREEKPDLILLDVMMTHDREGFEIAKKLHEDPDTGSIPVILLTGIKRAKGLPFSFEPDEDWLPVKAVLDKPVKPEDLLRRIAQALGGQPDAERQGS